MTTTQHSNGPWIIDRGQIRDTDGNSLASVPYSLGGTQDYANARLIAAAPDLLLIAKDYVMFCELHDLEGATLDAARAAIAKAEGVA